MEQRAATRFADGGGSLRMAPSYGGSQSLYELAETACTTAGGIPVCRAKAEQRGENVTVVSCPG